jgi:hypothetical protein
MISAEAREPRPAVPYYSPGFAPLLNLPRHPVFQQKCDTFGGDHSPDRRGFRIGERRRSYNGLRLATGPTGRIPATRGNTKVRFDERAFDRGHFNPVVIMSEGR